MTLEYGSDVPDVIVPERYGYEFVGWNPMLPDHAGNEDTVFTAVWEVGTYSIVFVLDTDSPVSMVTSQFGAPVARPVDPVREGYRFVGWNIPVPDSMPGEDLIIQASWEHSIHKLILDMGSDIIVLYGHMGDPVEFPESVISGEGYAFKGWSGDVPDVFPDNDVILHATWSPDTYSLTFDLDDDVVYELQRGEPIPEIDVQEREGYHFLGWNESYDVMPARDVILTPLWTPATYGVTFDTNDGSDPVIISVRFGDDIPSIDLDVPGFVGWYPDMPDVMTAKDLTFRALLATEPTYENGVSVFRSDSEVVAFDVSDIFSDIFRVEGRYWIMECSLSSLTISEGYLVAQVLMMDTYGSYDISLRSVSGDISGTVAVGLPYLGHHDAEVDVKVIGPSGEGLVTTAPEIYGGRTYLVVDSPLMSMCQIIGESDDDDLEVPYVMIVPIGIFIATTVTFLIWRRFRT